MEDKPFEDIVLTNKEQGKGHTSQLSMKVLYVLLIILYLVAIYYTRRVSSSNSNLEIADFTVPFRSFSGVFSSVASMCVNF